MSGDDRSLDHHELRPSVGADDADITEQHTLCHQRLQSSRPQQCASEQHSLSHSDDSQSGNSCTGSTHSTYQQMHSSKHEAIQLH